MPWRDLDANINFPFEIRGEKADRVWIDELLNRVGLEGFGKRFPRELSGGMQQRAALVRALSFKPSVLLMDEPFGALDAFTREEMNRLVEEIWLSAPTTMVLITHSIEEAIFLSDRIVVMSRGRDAWPTSIMFPIRVPRSLEIMSTKEVFDLFNRIKQEIIGDRQRPSAYQPRSRTVALGAQAVTEPRRNPRFQGRPREREPKSASPAFLQRLPAGQARNRRARSSQSSLVAIVIIGGTQALLIAFKVPQYVFPLADRDRCGADHRFPAYRSASLLYACRACSAVSR